MKVDLTPDQLRRHEINSALDEAEASLARGEGLPVTEASMKALAEDAKFRLRLRIATRALQHLST
jgi:hypothetical protein